MSIFSVRDVMSAAGFVGSKATGAGVKLALIGVLGVAALRIFAGVVAGNVCAGVIICAGVCSVCNEVAVKLGVVVADVKAGVINVAVGCARAAEILFNPTGCKVF